MERQRGVLFLLVTLAVCLLVAQATLPPKITQHPDAEIAYKVDEKVFLPCTATGDPTPQYKWLKNDADITDDDDYQIVDGNLNIRYPSGKHEGLYQCVANNNYGTAVSTKTNLKLAVMESFPTLEGAPPTRTPVIGDALTLECNPPYNYPTGVIYWALQEHVSNQDKTFARSETVFTNIKTDARIALDYEGRTL